MHNYDYEQSILIRDLAYKLGLPMQECELRILRKNTLDLMDKLSIRFAKRDFIKKEIADAQNKSDEALELELLRKLNKLE